MTGRRKRRLKRKMRFVVFLLVLVGLFAGGFAAANNLLWPLFTDTGNNTAKARGRESEQDLTKLPGVNVLMMGVDERESDRSQRTDTMILANINNEDNRISLLSIPRDTKVNLPGHGVNKINAANLYGGPEMAMDVVSKLTGVPVDYYIITNFNGFKGIVDALGGVTLEVEKPMYYHEDAYGGAYDINLQKGVQRLDGTKALMYARYRHDALGDITRTQRQLKLLTAIGEEVMKPSVVTKLPKLIPEIYKNVDTNMGLKQMIAFALAGSNLDSVQLVSQTMPGWFLDENGVSYWYVDPQDARQVATALFEEGKVVDVVHGAINRNTEKQVAMEQPKKTSQPEVDNGAAGTTPAAENRQLAGKSTKAESQPAVDKPAGGEESTPVDNATGDQAPAVELNNNGHSTQDQEPVSRSKAQSGINTAVQIEETLPVDSNHVQIIINP
ncbi:LCP family protein [Desulfoscipio geothermicus]|uniref:Transcriptional attenuator, LytR family n=1 Tax=Desulfoscipio geothermicus DSM 3669 TaxID=1121426 RepID=A0A1I6DEF4_9FIRM|nr:LCP family protein [Desulfoscipio geothermicus]SFR03751.1 transcriptional attenuator, LytR family [Desulfoscipio geothermicus DSM 3669]